MRKNDLNVFTVKRKIGRKPPLVIALNPSKDGRSASVAVLNGAAWGIKPADKTAQALMRLFEGEPE